MRKREYRVPVYLTRQEKEELRKKAQAACMEQTRFIRMLIAGYTPRPAPDERFYEFMDLIREMGDKLDNISAHIGDPRLSDAIEHEAEKWHLFQNAIEKRYLVPDRSDE